MSESNPTAESSNPETTDAKRARCGRDGSASCRGGHRRRRWRFFAFLGLFALGAFALPRAFAHGPGGWSCHRGEEMTAEQTREHLGRMAGHALDRVDASDDQRAKIDGVLDRAAPDVVHFKGEADALRDAFHETVAADRLDRAELDGLRREALELADRASARALDVALEVANVLTPDQRRQLRERAGIELE